MSNMKLHYDETVLLLQKENAQYLEDIFRLTMELEELKSEKAKAKKTDSSALEETQDKERL